MEKTPAEKKIVVQKNGPYLASGGIPLVRKMQVVSEKGEPLTWKKTETYSTGTAYRLCRCGLSKRRPFCDNNHARSGFDGTETADPTPTAKRQSEFPDGTQIRVHHDDYLCMESGFCGTRWSTLSELVCKTEDGGVRGQVIGMIERCPSGSLTYAMGDGEDDIEPDLPAQIAATTDVTCNGPVDGALWVTGGIPVERSDGIPFEIRNRVTLCSCGRSAKKPLCDGAHRRRKPDGA
jgi:CDGSH-type Zn-finger protein